jgi:hypothetical protein
MSVHKIVFYFFVRAKEIDPGKHHEHLFSRYLPHFSGTPRPRKPVLLQPFHPQAESVPVPVQHFHQPPRAPAEYEHVPSKWAHFHLLLYEYGKASNLLPHVSMACSQVNRYTFPANSHQEDLRAESKVFTRCSGTSGCRIIRTPPVRMITALHSCLPIPRIFTNAGAGFSVILRFQYRKVLIAIPFSVQYFTCDFPLVLCSLSLLPQISDFVIFLFVIVCPPAVFFDRPGLSRRRGEIIAYESIRFIFILRRRFALRFKVDRM